MRWIKRGNIVDSRSPIVDAKFGPKHLGFRLVSEPQAWRTDDLNSLRWRTNMFVARSRRLINVCWPYIIDIYDELADCVSSRFISKTWISSTQPSFVLSLSYHFRKICRLFFFLVWFQHLFMYSTPWRMDSWTSWGKYFLISHIPEALYLSTFFIRLNHFGCNWF